TSGHPEHLERVGAHRSGCRSLLHAASSGKDSAPARISRAGGLRPDPGRIDVLGIDAIASSLVGTQLGRSSPVAPGGYVSSEEAAANLVAEAKFFGARSLMEGFRSETETAGRTTAQPGSETPPDL